MRLLKVLCFLFCAQVSYTQTLGSNDALSESVYYFIRHAEKDRSNPENKNPELNQQGKIRALNWLYFFRDIPLKKIYSTNYNRTIQTVKQIAEEKKISISYYSPENIDVENFKKQNKNMSILVVGHSNTTPELVNLIIGENKFEKMNDNDNSSLFVIRELAGDVTVERMITKD
ncbi:MAG: histidine phosphatase family protein [Flavobacteriaceae bacterium]|nr:histidine phosphatase family protein [Flavobacteriaceae bacterium]